MSPDPFPDPLVVVRYLRGEASTEERQRIEGWLDSVPEQRAVLAALRAGLTAAHGPVPAYDREARIAAIVDYSARAARRAQLQPIPAKIDARGQRSFGRIATRIALAAAAIAVCVVGGEYIVRHRSSATSFVGRYVTAPGEEQTVVLPDGSTIKLAPRTVLETRLDENDRTVTIAGEAFFRVVPESRRPFVVRTGTTRTRVLGTSFGVNYDAKRHHLQVAVVSGKVGVTVVRGPRAAGERTLSAGMVAHIADSTATVSVGDADVATSWVNGQLVFSMIPVSQVLATVGDWYGYDLRLADSSDSSLAKTPVITTVTTRSVSDALTGLRDLLDVDMAFTGKTVILRRRSRASRSIKSEIVDSMTSLPHTIGR